MTSPHQQSLWLEKELLNQFCMLSLATDALTVFLKHLMQTWCFALHLIFWGSTAYVMHQLSMLLYWKLKSVVFWLTCQTFKYLVARVTSHGLKKTLWPQTVMGTRHTREDKKKKTGVNLLYSTPWTRWTTYSPYTNSMEKNSHCIKSYLRFQWGLAMMWWIMQSNNCNI